MNTEDIAREQLWDIIKDIKFSMFTTHGADGSMQSRPMTTQNRCLDEDDRLWFFMSRRSESIRELERQAVVNVSHSDPGKDSYVSVSGTARVVDDKNRLKALWSKKAEAWFPGGVDDPDLALVEVQISHAHYWDVTDNHLVQPYKMAKAVVTGEPPHDMTHLGEVRMR